VNQNLLRRIANVAVIVAMTAACLYAKRVRHRRLTKQLLNLKIKTPAEFFIVIPHSSTNLAQVVPRGTGRLSLLRSGCVDFAVE